MVTLEGMVLDIERILKYEYEEELSYEELKEVKDIVLSDSALRDVYEKTISRVISKYLRSRDHTRVLDTIYTPVEAAKLWGLSPSHLRNMLNRFGDFDEYIDRGWVKKSGSTWLITERAMRQVFGEQPHVHEVNV